MYDVVALGELLIDFTPAETSPAGRPLFEQNPGGAPANVLTALTRLGGRGAFIGMVGEDQFGFFLRDVLQKNGVESRGLKFTTQANTTLAFVHLNADGDRSFSFYRKPGADLLLKEEDIDFHLLDQAKIFHFGSLSLTDEPARSSTLKAAEYAKRSGKIISYDPNWRPPLWESDRAAWEGMSLGLKYADIIKISESELAFLTGEQDLRKGSEKLFAAGAKLVLVTLGGKGCFYKCAAGTGHVDTFKVQVVDTTGAGDAFLGGLLYHLSRLQKPLTELRRDELEQFIRFANAVGALCTTKKGAIPAMPELGEVERLITNCYGQ